VNIVLHLTSGLQLDPGTYTVGDASVETFLRNFNAANSSDTLEKILSDPASPQTPNTSPQKSPPMKAKTDILKVPITHDHSSSPLTVVASSSPIQPRRVSSFVKSSHVADDDSDSDDLEIVPATRAAIAPRPVKELANLAGVRLAGKSKSNSETKKLQIIIEEKQREQVLKERQEKQDLLRAKGITLRSQDDKVNEDILVESLLERERQRAEEIRMRELEGDDGDAGFELDDSENDVEQPETVGQSDASEDESDDTLAGKYVQAAAVEDTDNSDVDEEIAGQSSDDDNGAMLDDGFFSDADKAVQVPSSIPEQAVGSTHGKSRRARKRQVLDDEDEEDANNLDFISSPVDTTTQSDEAAPIDYAETQQINLPDMDETQPVLSSGNLPDLVDLFSDTQGANNDIDQLSPMARVKLLQQRGAEKSPDVYEHGPHSDTEAGPDMAALRAAYLKDHIDFPLPTQLCQLPDPSQMQDDIDEFNVTNEDDLSEIEDEQPVGVRGIAPQKRSLQNKLPVTPIKKHKSELKRRMTESKKTIAKDLIEEEAVESEDEWAGLGGESDDEDGEAKDLEGLVNDTSIEPSNAARIAQLFAKEEKARDEEIVNKILGDVTNGNWRRKRAGGILDLSDLEDDEDYIREREMREKARIAKMLESQSLGTLASNTKAQAFLASIADPMTVRTISECTMTSDDSGSKPTYESLRATLAFLDEGEQKKIGTENAEPSDELGEVTDAGIRVARRSNAVDTLALKRSIVENARSMDGIFGVPARRTAYASFVQDQDNGTRVVRIETQLTSSSLNSTSSHKATVVQQRKPEYLAKAASRALVAAKSLKKTKDVLKRSRLKTRQLFDKSNSWE
jgi:mediator of replication checkpoint protein 1